ncbi:MAG: hypothetical protein WDO71_28375 [Bacteroidota bacterium]
MNEQRLKTIREVLKGNLQFIKSSESSSGLGYIMISELLRIHNLELQIGSEVNKGTIVSLVIT